MGGFSLASAPSHQRLLVTGPYPWQADGTPTLMEQDGGTEGPLIVLTGLPHSLAESLLSPLLL